MLSCGGWKTPIHVSMHWTAPAPAALLLRSVPLTASTHDGAVKMLSGKHVLDLRGATPAIDAEPVTSCTSLTPACGNGEDELSMPGGNGATAGPDRMQARDGAFDVVDGGSGRDAVRADRSDRVRNVERRR